MKCKNFCELVSEYIDQELDEELQGLFEEHLLKCEKCTSLLNTMRKTIYFSKQVYKIEKVPTKIVTRIYSEIHIIYEKKSKK